MTGEVLILTGPPGAGTSTVAELLASTAVVPTVNLTTDLFYRSIRTGFVAPFLPEAQRQNEVVIDAIVATVRTFARGGFDVVVDGIVGPWFLPPFRRLLAEGVVVSYVVLRPSLDRTLDRARERAGQELRDVVAITGLHDAFSRLGTRTARDRQWPLDAGQTCAAVRSGVASGHYRLA